MAAGNPSDINSIAQALAALAASPRGRILDRFSADPDRLSRLTLEAAGLFFDWSRTDLDAEVLAHMAALASAMNLAGACASLAAGGMVNASEGRAATHMAERGTGPDALVTPARNREAKMLAVAEQLRGQGVAHLLHIGIGGSALGPAFLLDALGRDGDGPQVEVVANIDGEALARACARIDPARTVPVIVSKTFTTAETMTNAESAIRWMEAAGIADARSRSIAVTAAPDVARAWGAGSILEFAQSVGGRYSLWSAVGLPFVARCGPAAWAALKAGAAAMDAHFLEVPWLHNAPVMAAFADLWAHRYHRQPVRGVFAYDERLRLLPLWLQQLEMESNGKGVTSDGQPVSGPTAPITWGGTGTDAQHAVFQLLHQGSVPGPVEFLAVRQPGHGLDSTHHRQLLANCLAQGAALLAGRSHADPARAFPGNRPNSTILLDRLDPFSLGALLAFHEARTYAGAVLMGINPFDQWGVELGKEMAGQLLGGDTGHFDPSSAALARRLFGG